jgi:hypothetical protein
MAERTLVDLIEDWQTGFFVILGCVLAGALVGIATRRVFGAPGFVVGLFGGTILAFVAYAYLRYGR